MYLQSSYFSFILLQRQTETDKKTFCFQYLNLSLKKNLDPNQNKLVICDNYSNFMSGNCLKVFTNIQA